MKDLKQKLLDECLSAGVDENTKFFESLISIIVQQREALAYVGMSVPNNFIAGMPRDVVIEQLEFANSTIVGDAKRAKQTLAATDEALKGLGIL